MKHWTKSLRIAFCSVYITWVERVLKYTIYTKVCGQPLTLVDLAMSATPVADRFIQFSTHSYNLHRHTLAVEWPYWRAQWLSTWHRYRMPLTIKSVHQMSTLLELPQSIECAVIVKWKHLGATTAQPWSGRPHKLTEWDSWALKRVKIIFPWLQHSLPSSKPLEAMWDPNGLWKQRQFATWGLFIMVKLLWMHWCKWTQVATLEKKMCLLS